MISDPDHQYSESVTVFRDRRLPEPARLAGNAALVARYELQVPLPALLHATGERHRAARQGGWQLLPPRHAPEDSLTGHLTFALKREGLDLLILKRLFAATGPRPIEGTGRPVLEAARARILQTSRDHDEALGA